MRRRYASLSRFAYGETENIPELFTEVGETLMYVQGISRLILKKTGYPKDQSIIS